MLDDRAKLLLKALVERYIADGQPVGSRTLSRASGLELSPATIRNVMADLEELGLIASPHTSAGRIPTARGYRLFVDTMLTAQRERLDTPSLAPDQPQRVIAKAANLLSSLSHFVGVVTAPRRTSVFPPHRVPAACPNGACWSSWCRPTATCRTAVIFTAGRLHPVPAGRGHQLPQRALRGPDIEQVRDRLQTEVERCAARSPR